MTDIKKIGSEDLLQELINKKQKMIKCKNCSQYTHKGNFCEQCGCKLATINHFSN